MNNIKNINEQIMQLKLEKQSLKKASFEEFLVKHFKRSLKAGDIVECKDVTRKEQYYVRGIECIEGTHMLDCYAIKDGLVLDTFEKALPTGCNFQNKFTKTQIKFFKFRHVA